MISEAAIKPVIQIAIGAAIIFSITYIAGAFAEPTFTPQTGNAPPPIHEGDSQVKSGGLGVLGRVTVGNNADNVAQYFQLDTVNAGGLSSADCDTDGTDDTDNELGRMVYDRNSNFLFVCAVDDSSQIIQWKYLVPVGF